MSKSVCAVNGRCYSLKNELHDSVLLWKNPCRAATKWLRRLHLLISDYLCITTFIGDFLEYLLGLGNSFISVKIACDVS